MGMQINTNLAANNSYRSLSNTQTDLGKSLEKLSSGLRINRASDDAAGLALSEGLQLADRRPDRCLPQRPGRHQRQSRPLKAA